MKWPARPPDLNPIENLWSILAAKVYAKVKQDNNVNIITTSFLPKWARIELETLRNLVNLIPKRCIEVIELRGNMIHN